jgi:hypothetical protein
MDYFNSGRKKMLFWFHELDPHTLKVKPADNTEKKRKNNSNDRQPNKRMKTSTNGELTTEWFTEVRLEVSALKICE